MKNVFHILFFMVLFCSCQQNATENEVEVINTSHTTETKSEAFYFPHQSKFLESNNQYVNLKSFSTFDQLVDSVQKLKSLLKEAAFKLETEEVDYHVLASHVLGLDNPAIIKMKNILLVSRDSVKKNVAYPIEDLKEVLKKDLLNKGKDDQFSESPERLRVAFTTTIEDSENLLIYVLEAFQDIQKESTDSLSINVQMNGLNEVEIPKRPIEE